MQVSTLLSDNTFYFTVLAADFGCYWLKFISALPSEVFVLFIWKMSRFHLLSQVLNLDLLRCTGFQYDSCGRVHIPCFTHRPIKDQKIESSNERCFGLWHVLLKSMKFHVKLLICKRSLFALNPLPVLLPNLCQRVASRALPLILQSKPWIVFSNSLQEWWPLIGQRPVGLKFGLKVSNLNSAAWPIMCKGFKFISSGTTDKLCGIWICFCLLKMPKLRQVL